MRRHRWEMSPSWWPWLRHKTVGVDQAVGQDVTATTVFDTTGQTVVILSSEVKTAEAYGDS